jgi:hypothetical protein
MYNYCFILPTNILEYVSINNIYLTIKTFHPFSVMINQDNKRYFGSGFEVPEVFYTNRGVFIRLIFDPKNIYFVSEEIRKACLIFLNQITSEFNDFSTYNIPDFSFITKNRKIYSTNKNIKKCSLFEMEIAYMKYYLINDEFEKVNDMSEDISLDNLSVMSEEIYEYNKEY